MGQRVAKLRGLVISAASNGVYNAIVVLNEAAAE
jgi:hypothetical protein